MNWETYCSKLKIGDIREVDCLEFSDTRGDCHVRCLMLEKIGHNEYVLSIQRPISLVHMEDAEFEVDAEGNYLPLEEVDGEPVYKLLGDYFCGYEMSAFPDDGNHIKFSNLKDPQINLWLADNRWSENIESITPEETTRIDW